jgi:hypothetical protein
MPFSGGITKYSTVILRPGLRKRKWARGPVRALLLARPHQDRPNEGVGELVAVVGERLEQRLNGCDESLVGR